MKTVVLKQKPASSNIAADRLATWAYTLLVNGEDKGYPLQNVRIGLKPSAQGVLLPDGILQINDSPPENSRNSKSVPEPIRIQREIKAVSAELGKNANFLKRCFNTSIIAEDLADAIERLTGLLVDLAGKDPTALHRLFGVAIKSVIELEKLSFREDSLRLIQSEASKQSLWPVPYSPHPRRKRELDKTMRKIELGKHNFQKLWGARDTDKSPAGKFARRIGSALWITHSMPGLKFFLSQQAVGMDANQRERYLLTQGWHNVHRFRVNVVRFIKLPQPFPNSKSLYCLQNRIVNTIRGHVHKPALKAIIPLIPSPFRFFSKCVCHFLSDLSENGASKCRSQPPTFIPNPAF
ncbi:MAG: hypothetical protein ACLQSR_09315 [Limisphaerales bacterium]